MKTKYTKFQLLLEGTALLSLIVYVLFITNEEGNLLYMKMDSSPIVAIFLYVLLTIATLKTNLVIGNPKKSYERTNFRSPNLT
jgi:galactitol-specific phosphotransferase system IIC component